MPKYLSVSQLAARWAPIGRTTIRRLIARGLLRGLRVGEKVLIEIESVTAYERDHRAEGRAAS